MVTYDELRQEPAWNAEFIPEGLARLRIDTLNYFGWPGERIGIIGDNRHLAFYHRSRRWIAESQYCTNRSASVTETEGNRTGGNPNAVAGMDIITNQATALAMWIRINTAKVAGRLPQLRQVILESNPAHVHLSFDRGHLDDDHSLLFQLITNQQSGGQPMVTVRAEMPELRQGSQGDHVKTWQMLCNRRGATLSVDGEFGPKTHAATRAVQQNFGAESVDGIVGPETWVIGLAGEDQV